MRAASIDEVQAALWIQAGERGIWDVLTALVLSVLPKLQELERYDWRLSSVAGLETPFLDALYDRAADFQNRAVPSPYVMSNLKDISLFYWDMEMGK